MKVNIPYRDPMGIKIGSLKKNPRVSRQPPFRPGSLYSFRFILVDLVKKKLSEVPRDRFFERRCLIEITVGG